MSATHFLSIGLFQFILSFSALAQAIETPKSLDEIESIEMVFSDSLGVKVCPQGYEAITGDSSSPKCIPKSSYVYPVLWGENIDTPEECLAAYDQQQKDLRGGLKLISGAGASLALLAPPSLSITLPIMGWVLWKSRQHGDRTMGQLSLIHI